MRSLWTGTKKLFSKSRKRSSKFVLSKRLRPFFEPLEDRIVLSVLAAGGTWTDAYTDSSGIYHPQTVMVVNDGPGDLNVSGGGGSASLSPANGSQFSAFVDGNVVWSGDTQSLGLQATGNIAPISISGDVNLNAGGDIGAITAGTVWAAAGGNIAGVTAQAVTGVYAVNDIGGVSAVGEIGTVEAGPQGSVAGVVGGGVDTVIAGQGIGGVISYTDINSVQAGLGIGLVTATDGINSLVAGTFIGPVTAGGDIDDIQAATLGATISAGGTIEYVVGGTVGGTIEAGGDIQWVDGSAGYGSGNVSATITAGGAVQNVIADGDIGGSISAGAVDWVIATGSISAAINASGDVGADLDSMLHPDIGIQAGQDFTGSIDAGGDVGSVTSLAGNVGGSINAGGDIQQVNAFLNVSIQLTVAGSVQSIFAGQDVAGSLQAGQDFVTIYATRDITATITAGGSIGTSGPGDWQNVAAGRDFAGTLTAAGNIGAVSAIGDLDGSIQAGGNIDWLAAGNDFGATVNAGGNLRHAEAMGDLPGSIATGGDIGTVYADGTMTGSLNAAGSIDFLWSALDTGAVTAGGALNAIYAGRNVAGPVKVGGAIGRDTSNADGWYLTDSPAALLDLNAGFYPTHEGIEAGNDIAGDISAGSLITYIHAGGDIADNVTSGGDIYVFTADGSIAASVNAAGTLGRLPGPNDTTNPYSGEGVIAGLGITGAFQAGGIGNVHAGGSITANLSAAGDIGDIDAGLSILGNLTAAGNIGDITAEAGSILGFITAGGQAGNITAYAALDIADSLVAISITAGGPATIEGSTVQAGSFAVMGGAIITGALSVNLYSTGADTTVAGALISVNSLIVGGTLHDPGSVSLGAGGVGSAILDVSGLLHLAAGSVFGISGASDTTGTQASIDGDGIAVMDASSSLAISGAATINNLTMNGGTILGSGTANLTGVMDLTADTQIQAKLNSTDTIDAQAGAAVLTGGGSFCGLLEIEEGAEFDLSDGTYTATSLQAQGDGVMNVGGTNGQPIYNPQGATQTNLNLHRGGRIEGGGTLNITSQMIWSGGSMEGTGVTQIAASAGLNINFAEQNVDIVTRTLTNNGHISVTSPAGRAATWFLRGGATVQNNLVIRLNAPSQNLTVRQDGRGTSWINDGNVLVSSGSNVVTFYQFGSTPNAILNQADGLFGVQGNLTFTGDNDVVFKSNVLANYGMLYAQSGSTVNFSGGLYYFYSGSGLPAMSGPGSFIVTAAGAASQINIEAGCSPVTATNFYLQAGSLTGPGTFEASFLDWSGGEMDGSGVTLLQGGDRLLIETSVTLDTRTIADYGTVTWQNAESATFSMLNSAQIQVGNGGTFQTFIANCEFTTTDETDENPCKIVVSANGSFTANATEVPGTITFQLTFQNNGGTATFNQDATFTNGYSQTQATSVSSFGSGSYVFQAPNVNNAIQINGGTFLLFGGQITNPQISGYPFQNATIQCSGSIAFFGITNQCTVNFTGDLTVQRCEADSSTVYFNGQTLWLSNGLPLKTNNAQFVGPGTWRFGNITGIVPPP